MKFTRAFCFLVLIGGAMAAFNSVIRSPRCLPMADVGPCDARIRVFGYDYVTNQCVHFFYGGCGGNPNRFDSRKECMDTCYVENADGKSETEEALFELLYKDEL